MSFIDIGSRSFACPLSTFSIDFFSETIWLIWIKFLLQPSGKGGKKDYMLGLGHMFKMATMPIYGKNLKTSSSPELP